MIKIEGMRLFSNRFPFSWNEKELEVVNVLVDSYEIYDDKTMDARNFTLVYYIINK